MSKDVNVNAAGECHAHNVGASLLTCLNMEKDWLANTEQEYIDLAIKAASNIPELIQTRKTLRDRFLASPLCQVKGFIQSLEQEYFAMFDRWKSAA